MHLTVVLLDGSSDTRFLYGISITLKEAVARTTYERFWFSVWKEKKTICSNKPWFSKINAYSKILFVYPEEVVNSQSGVDEEDGVFPPLQSSNLTLQPQTIGCGAILHKHTDVKTCSQNTASVSGVRKCVMYQRVCVYICIIVYLCVCVPVSAGRSVHPWTPGLSCGYGSWFVPPSLVLWVE